MKRISLLLAILFVFSMPAAMAHLPDPGITPNSPFFFVDSFFDGFRNPSEVASERASEVLILAQQNKEQALTRALNNYEKAMEKANSKADTPEEAEYLALEVADHLEAFNSSELPEQAKNQLKEAHQVAIQKLEGLLERVPESARPGLERALHAVESEGAPGPREDVGAPDEPGKPDDVGEPDDVGNQSEHNESMEDEEVEEESHGNASKERAGGEGELELLVTDAPADIEDFEYLIVHVSEARVFQEDSFNGSNDTKAWFMTPVNESFDLTMLVNGSVFSLVDMVLDAGKYSKVELYVESVNGSVDNESASVKVPSNKLMLLKGFTINANETTAFVFDIHVARTGKDLDYNLRPVIAKSGTVGEEVEEDDVEVVECTLDEDCSEALVCIEGSCVEDPAECHEDEDCDDEFVCLAEMCVVAPQGNETNVSNSTNESVEMNVTNTSNQSNSS